MPFFPPSKPQSKLTPAMVSGTTSISSGDLLMVDGNSQIVTVSGTNTGISLGGTGGAFSTVGAGGAIGTWGSNPNNLYYSAGGVETEQGRFIRMRRDLLHMLGDNHEMDGTEKDLVLKLIEHYDSRIALNKLKG